MLQKLTICSLPEVSELRVVPDTSGANNRFSLGGDTFGRLN